MLALLSFAAWAFSVPHKDVVMQAEGLMPSCTETASNQSSYLPFLEDAHASTAVETAFGRNMDSTSPCACRFCDGVETSRRPRQVLDDADVSLCFSTDTSNDEYIDDCMLSTFAAGGLASATEADIPRYGDMLERCLTPDRDNHTLPSRTLWMIGDSLIPAIKPAVSLAVRGVYQVRSFAIAMVGVIVAPGYKDDKVAIVTALYDRLKRLLRIHMRAGDLLVLLNLDTRMTNTSVGVIEHELLEQIILPAHASLLVFGAWPNSPEAAGTNFGTTCVPGSRSLDLCVASACCGW
jgi:hypothetical protein